MHKSLSALLAASFLALGSVAHSDPFPVSAQPVTAARLDAPSFELRGGRWFDGKGFRAAHWYVVGGKFTARRPARVDAVIDLGSRYVLPPLAEAHNHNMQNSWGAETFAQDYLKRGIFYSAQLAANPEEIAPFRGLLTNPGAVDVLFAAVTISASDGHPLGLALDSAKAAGMDLKAEDVRDHAFFAIDSKADLEAKWPRMAASGTKLVKVILVESELYQQHHNNPAFFGVNGIDPALLPEIVARAHAMGARVAVHTDTAHDAEVAVNAGADIIAHLPGYRIDSPLTIADYRLSDATIATAAKRGTLWIGTVAASKYYDAKHPDHAAEVQANYRDNLLRLRRAGVPFLTGSDLFDGSVIDELDAVDALQAMPRAELLDDATRVTPLALFPGRQIGCLCEGAEASLIALDANPLDRLGALRHIALAMKQGELLAR